MKWVLVIAWMIPGQPVVSSQVDFTSHEACIKGSSSIVAEFSRKQTKGEVVLACMER